MKRRKKLGVAFPSEMAKVTFKGHFKKAAELDWKDALLPNFNQDSDLSEDVSYLEKRPWRKTLFLCLIIIFFFVLFLRLFNLQIINGSQNRQLADGNRIQIRIIHVQRGVIFDRNGQILASNSPGFRLNDPKTKKATFVSREQALEMEVKDDPRFNNLEVDSIRTYPYGAELAHVLGYVGEVSENQLINLKSTGYRSGDRIGQSGVEDYYEGVLRGQDGGEIIEVDSTGKKIRTLRTILPKPGKNIYLTIDQSLQHVVFNNLQEGVKKANSCCGAAVAVDPKNGQVLALVSYPSFDNNIFTNPKNASLVEDVLLNSNSPILNRSIGGTYPPGSTFKIVTSLSALGSGKITPDTQIEDTGQIFLGAFKFTNWYFTQYGRTEGFVNLVKALERSNDTYFYRVGQTIGEKVIMEWAKKLKLGGKLGIDLGGEVSGLVADNDWKMKNFGQPWYPGDTLHLAIGQGFLLTTPLQILGITAFIAADGNLYKPQILLKSTTSDNRVTNEFKPELLVSKIVSPDIIKVIKNGLEKVPQDGGTAWPFFTFPISTAGKTGTAEYGDSKDRTHAWYTSYAPSDDPKIALTVLVEGGGEGSNVSAPIAKEIYRWYFSPDKSNLIKDSGGIATDSAKILGE